MTEITAADLGHKEFWAKWYYISDTSTYSVILPDTVEGGKVTAAKGYAEEGEIVRLTVTPEEGYVLSALTVTRSNGGKLTLTEEGAGCLVLPDACIPGHRGGRLCTIGPAFHRCSRRGLVSQRRVVCLHPRPGERRIRYDLCPRQYHQPRHDRHHPVAAGGRPVGQTDARPISMISANDGQWYSEAIRWAASEGIAGGYGDGRFGTDDPITREQFAAMLYRYAQKQGYDVSIGEETNILSYIDAQEISEHAIPAMQWACGAGVIQGDGNALNPQGHAARSEAAAMLMRFCKNMEK